MLKIYRTSRDLLGSSLYAYNLHEGKITWEILRKMRYFLCHRKYLPLTAAESLISLCLSHPFLGMFSVPGWYLCSRHQWVIYFLLIDKEEGLYQDTDCWTVLIASLPALWRVLGEEAWGLAASGLTLSKHTKKDGEREIFLQHIRNWTVPLATNCCWSQVCIIWRVCVLETRRPERSPSSVLRPSGVTRERLGGHAKQKHLPQVLLSGQPYPCLFFASWMTVGVVF